MALTREILSSHPVAHLKKFISSTNIKGYSRMKKAEVIDLIMSNKSRFSHIKKHTPDMKIKPKKDDKVVKFLDEIAHKNIDEKVKKTIGVKFRKGKKGSKWKTKAEKAEITRLQAIKTDKNYATWKEQNPEGNRMLYEGRNKYYKPFWML